MITLARQKPRSPIDFHSMGHCVTPSPPTPPRFEEKGPGDEEPDGYSRLCGFNSFNINLGRNLCPRLLYTRLLYTPRIGAQSIQRADDPNVRSCQHMCINHRRRDIAMPKQLLDRSFSLAVLTFYSRVMLRPPVASCHRSQRFVS